MPHNPLWGADAISGPKRRGRHIPKRSSRAMSETEASEAAGTGTEEDAAEVTGTTEDAKQTEKRTDPTDQLPADHPLVKALAAQKATIKELKTKAARLDAIEESQKSELQKWQERAESAEGAISALQAAEQIRNAKSDISKRYKDAGYDIPASALRGSDLEELEEHALELKALLPEPRKAGQVPSEGRTVSAGNNDPAQQFANIITNARRG